MKTFPRVSVLILNYRNALQTVKCVEALQEQTVIDQCEIIVIDNHSDSDSIGILRRRLEKFPAVEIVETPRNLGFGGGYNAGARAARGEYLLINNPDKMLQRDGIERLVEKMESDSSIGIIGPKLQHDDGTCRLSARRFPHWYDGIVKRTFLHTFFPKVQERYLELDKDIDEERTTDWVAGGCMFIRRDFYDELGGFDDRFFLFFEDTDLCKRTYEAGKSVLYFPSVVAGDKKARLSGGTAWSMIASTLGRIHIVSAVKYFWKWRGC